MTVSTSLLHMGYVVFYDGSWNILKISVKYIIVLFFTFIFFSL